MRWVEEELKSATERALRTVLILHCYPSDLKIGSAELRELVRRFDVSLGIEAAVITRRRLPKCKILLFSGQAATADLVAVARSEGHEFKLLTKPVHPTDLLTKLWG